MPSRPLASLEAAIGVTDVGLRRFLSAETRAGARLRRFMRLPTLYVVNRRLQPSGILRSPHASFMRL